MIQTGTDRLLALLRIRKAKIERELMNLSSGRTSGRKLRDDLVEKSPDHRFADLTQPFVNRTVDILTRGLALIETQHADVVVRLRALDETERILKAMQKDALDRQSRQRLEDFISEFCAGGPPRTSRQGRRK
ncbi:MAG: hypothetical protein NW216_11465 [Hyphomicrobium sp.]|nr:hypothetical protein [Hyphomicrobium sp.]